MKTNTFLTRAIAVILLVFTGACDKQNQPALDLDQRSARSASAVRENQQERTRVGEPKQPQYSSWRELLESKTEADRQFLQELDRRYFGAVAFESPQEQAFLAMSGFPSPEEWLAAERMTDTEMRALADNGDKKVAGMLAHRMAVRFERMLGDTSTANDEERARTAASAMNYAHQSTIGSSGVFGLYVDGMVKSTILNTPEPMTAAMLEALNRGDPRVERLISEMSYHHPKQDISRVFTTLKNWQRK